MIEHGFRFATEPWSDQLHSHRAMKLKSVGVELIPRRGQYWLIASPVMTSRSDACAPAAETERVRVEGFTNRLICHSFLRLN